MKVSKIVDACVNWYHYPQQITGAAVVLMLIAAIFWRFDIVGVIAVSYSMLAVIAFVHIQTEHQPYPRDINFDRGE